MRVLGPIDDDGRPHSYCPACRSPRVRPDDRDGREYYRCDACGYDGARLVMIDPGMRYRIRDDQELVHYAVGAVIEWRGKLLLFRRRLFPFRYTIVAGHWDHADATPEAAMEREIREEAGLELVPREPIAMETLNDPCRRGADVHEWRLYRFSVNHHRVVMSDEAEVIGWYSRDEIRGLDLTIPTEHFLGKLGVL